MQISISRFIQGKAPRSYEGFVEVVVSGSLRNLWTDLGGKPSPTGSTTEDSITVRVQFHSRAKLIAAINKIARFGIPLEQQLIRITSAGDPAFVASMLTKAHAGDLEYPILLSRSA